MSIIDSVLKAEQQAEQHRLNAQNEVRELIEKTKEAATRKAQEIIGQANGKKDIIWDETRRSIEAESKELDVRYRNDDERVSSLANGRMNDAVLFIVKKVFET